MALILRRERRLIGGSDHKFVFRDEHGHHELMLFMSQEYFFALGEPEALAITYEAYEEPTRAK